MTDWKNSLRSLGAREPDPVPPPAAPTPAEPEPSADPEDYPRWALDFAAAAIEVLGERRLVEGLERGLGDHSRRSAESFSARLERALDRLPGARYDELRPRCSPGVLWNGKGLPTWQGRAELVLDAIQSGAVRSHLAREAALEDEAEQLEPPSAREGEDLSDYAARVRAWAGEISRDLLRRAGIDPYRLVEDERRRRENAEAERRATTERLAVEAFEAGGDLGALKEVVGLFRGEEIAAESRYGWELWRRRAIRRLPPGDPGPFLASVTDAGWLLGRVDLWRAHEAACRARLLDLVGDPGEGRARIVRGRRDGVESYWAVGSSWVTELQQVSAPGRERSEWVLSERDGVLPTEPSPEGWIEPSVTGLGPYGWTSGAYVWRPEHYHALRAVDAHEPRGIDLSVWRAAYGRHPDRGFGRFLLGSSFGRSRDCVVVSVCDRTATYLDHVVRYPHGAPESAWRVPVRVSPSRSGRGAHLTWDERAPEGAALTESAHWQRLSRRDKGSTIGLGEGSTAAWAVATSASTPKHRVTGVRAVVLEGQRVCLDSGAAWVYEDGELRRVPGGAEASS